MVGSPRNQAAWVFVIFGVLGLLLTAVLITPFFMPCLLKIIFDIPCPACGLTRAFVAATRFNLVRAITYNILFLPMVAYFLVLLVCAVIDLVTNKGVLLRFNLICKKKWVIAVGIGLLLISWVYNFLFLV